MFRELVASHLDAATLEHWQAAAAAGCRDYLCAHSLQPILYLPSFLFRIGFDHLSVVSDSAVAVALRVDNVRELQNDVHTLGANGGIWAEQFAIQCVATFLDVHICILDKTKLKKNVLFTRISPSAEKNAPGYRANLDSRLSAIRCEG